MKKRIFKYEEFKLIKEEEGDEDLFNFDEGESGDEGEGEGDEDQGTDFDFGDDMEEESGDDMEESGMEDEEMEEEPEPEIDYNEDPDYYAAKSIETIQNRLESLFEEPQKDNKDIVEKDPSSYVEQGVQLMDSKVTDMPLNKTLMMKYADSQFIYQLFVTVNIEQPKPKEGDMDSSQIEECAIKFKKYNMENELIGEIERRKVNISELDQDTLDTLNAELDEKYSVDNDFEIEYKEEDEG